MKEIGYQPNIIARQFYTQKTNLVGLIFPYYLKLWKQLFWKHPPKQLHLQVLDVFRTYIPH